MSTPAVDKHYSLIIIGTGSGNSIPTPEFDDQSIAIIEEGIFGGTCLNVGCIPTKMYVHAADVAFDIAEGQKLGIHGGVDRVDWQHIVDRVFRNRIDLIAKGGEDYRRGPETPNIDVYDHHAVFVGPKTLKTGVGSEEKIISGDAIVIAAGSRPQILDVIANSGVTYHTNEDIMRLEQQPESLIIVGGGYIALEFAHVFDALGTKVSLVNRSEKLLRSLDHDVCTRLNDIVQQRYDTHTGVDIQSAENTDHGVKLSLSDGTELNADALLVATGRIPNGDLLDADKAGIELAEDGRRIKVDEFGRTSAPGVWAFGDISSPYLLKHVANAEMRAVRHNLLHPDDLQPMPHKHVPAAIFTHPQVAYVGLTEQQAQDQGYELTVKIQNYGDVAYGWALEDTTGFVKLIADKKTRKLLGAHLIGPQASTLIQQLITVMAFDLDVSEVATQQYWIHPALPEVIENALLGLEF
ncbi:mycothione reductase [Corynebacterium poyangense]|uniref:Mycothione reductase n=1 Tax=Corynebacterium poyangense TaxID=2684405 RepID=A0A7H0SPH3_9CORY|nr:mycothione reductase [Corynebacterium poyangense]QNQ90448.1 mycothione reductase [Corynebacterium poyangense]